MSKGEDTRQAIVEHALRLASIQGLGALSIGGLARDLAMSKSGLFAHFQSKENLQLQVLHTLQEEFVHAVMVPALRQPRGLPRVRALFENWLAWALRSSSRPGGCPFIGLAAELDDQPGPLRDLVVQAQRDWIDALGQAFRIAQAEGQLAPEADPAQLAFELEGQMLVAHLFRRLLEDGEAERRLRLAFDDLIARASAPAS